jgi:RHS repeat-associated protein
LLRVALVTREGAPNDDEHYRYDSANQRILKVSRRKTASALQIHRVSYLPDLELRSTHNGDTLSEALQTVTVGEAGRAQVRALYWVTGKPAQLSNGSLRYSYDDHLGSGCLEVDGMGAVITREEYYPYGGTAVWAADSEVKGRYKTVRHAGKEHDATGLYYYGYRYYQAWLGRWLSADPAGDVDGLNLFARVRNNPMTWIDPRGLHSSPTQPSANVKKEEPPSSNPTETQWLSVPSSSQALPPLPQAEGLLAHQSEDASGKMPWQRNHVPVITLSPPEMDAQIIRPDQPGVAETAFFANLYGEQRLAYKTHGHPNGQLLNRLGEWDSATNVARQDIAPFLVGQPEDKPLMLLACYSGKSGAAQEVANALGRPVIGFPRADEVITKHSSVMQERWKPDWINPFGNEVLQDRSGLWAWVERKVLRKQNKEVADKFIYLPTQPPKDNGPWEFRLGAMRMRFKH